MAMMKGLVVGAALGLTARRKRISPASFGIRRGSLNGIPSRAARPAQWAWSGDPDPDCRDRLCDGFPSGSAASFTLTQEATMGEAQYSADRQTKIDLTGLMLVDSWTLEIHTFEQSS